VADRLLAMPLFNRFLRIIQASPANP